MAEDFNKEIILSVKTDTSGAEQGIDNLNNKLDDLNNQSVTKPFKTFKTEIKEASNELKRMQDQFGTNSVQFAEAAKKVAGLKDKFGELNQTVSAFNPDNKLQSVVSLARGATGAVQGVAGAFALMGVESEDAQKTIAHLQGLMAFSDALNSVDDIKNSFKNFNAILQSSTVFQKANIAVTNLASGAMRLFGVAANTTGFAFKALKVAIASTGIGLLIVAIGTLLPKITAWISGSDDAEKAQQRLKDAVSSLNDALSINQGLVEHQTKLDEERIKQAGGTEEEIYQNKIDGLNKQFIAARTHADKLKALYQVEKLNEEDRKKANEDITKAYQESLRIGQRIDEEDAAHKTRIYEDGLKKQKDNAEKAKQLSEAAEGKRKAAAEKAQAQRQTELKELAELEAKALKDVSDSKLSAREKELNDLLIEFAEKKSKYEKYGKDVAAITLDYSIKRKVIEKQYATEVSDVIDEALLNDFDKQRKAIDKKYEEALAKAKTFKEQILLAGIQADEQGKVDTEQTNITNTVNSETNVINTEIGNAPNDKDNAQQRVEKLQNIYDAEKIFKETKFQEELAKLGSDQAAIANLTAQHNKTLLDDESAFSKARIEISDAEKAAKLANVESIGQAAGSLSNLIGKETVAGKALAIAQATIDTYAGASKALAQGGVKGIAQAVVVTAAGILNIKKILAVKVPTKAGGSAGAATPPQITAPVIDAAQTAAASAAIQDVRVINQPNQVSKAYITDRELQNSQQRSNFINNLSSF